MGLRLSRVLLGLRFLETGPKPRGYSVGEEQQDSLVVVFLFCDSVFQKSQKFQNQLILGVMAIDVSLEDIKRLTPRFTVNQHIQPVYKLHFMFAAAPVLR